MSKIDNSKSLKVAFRLLRTFCPEHLYDEICGDLMQRFEKDAKAYGIPRAKRRFIWNAVKFIRPGIILRNRVSSTQRPTHMFFHFLTVFWRNTAKHKSYAVINVIGLAVGMIAFAFIQMYVVAEKSFDDFHRKKENIFRVRHDRFTNGQLNRQFAAGPMGIGDDLKGNFGEVVRFVKLNKGIGRTSTLANGDTTFREEKLIFASEDFFRMFSYPLLSGVDSLVLRTPFTMVVSESLGRRYFGDADPVGKTLQNNGKETYLITGVFKDFPGNTHLKFDAILSFASLIKILGPEEVADLMGNWGWEGTYTYIELRSQGDAAALHDKLPAYVEKVAGETLRSWNEWMEFTLQPLTSIHLESNTVDEIDVSGDQKSVNLLSIVSLFILIMAWINYMNLVAARSVERTKEVGVRKILGSDRLELIKQFLLESFATKLCALVITVAAIALTSSWFEMLIGRQIEWNLLLNLSSFMWVVGVLLLGVIASGLYPALVISGFKPASLLKSNVRSSLNRNAFGKGLVTIQFISSIVLISATSVIYWQVEFLRTSPTGFDMEQVLVIDGPVDHDSLSLFQNNVAAFRQALLEYEDVKSVTVSTDVPGHHIRNSNGGVRVVGQDVKEGNHYQAIMADEYFLDAYELELIAGRNFSHNLNQDWKAVIVSQAAAKRLGFADPEKSLGKKIHLWDWEPEIIGVIKDFHQESLKKEISPIILVCDRGVSEFLSVKMKSSRLNEMVTIAETAYRRTFPKDPFTYFFVDDHYNNQFIADSRLGKIFGVFSAVAMVISGLGLFGLSSYLIVKRSGEISIRKVLGASVRQILVLISTEYLILVLLAVLLACPIGYLFMREWLSGFVRHIEINLLYFAVPGLTTALIALITVTTTSIKAATTNPADNLKSE